MFGEFQNSFGCTRGIGSLYWEVCKIAEGISEFYKLDFKQSRKLSKNLNMNIHHETVGDFFLWFHND